MLYISIFILMLFIAVILAYHQDPGSKDQKDRERYCDQVRRIQRDQKLNAYYKKFQKTLKK